MVVLEDIAVVPSILDARVMNFRIKYTISAAAECFIILKLPLREGAVFYWR